MSPAQTKFYWTLWNAASKAQGYDKLGARERDTLRYAAHKEADVPTSSKAINTKAQFDKIKAHFQMLANNLNGAIETDRPDLGEKRRLLTYIHCIQFPLLRALEIEPLFYLRPILQNRFKIDSVDQITDLSAQPRFRGGKERSSQLQMLIYTIQTTIQSKRKAREWTVHQLHAAAGLPCPFNCEQCEKLARLAPVLADPGDDNLPY